jgi:RyR domain
VKRIPLSIWILREEELTTLSYQPRPINTARVELSPEILQLIERLAENAHDVWAAKRLAEGWTFGPKKDGDTKQTPLLVPYADLPDSEKQYDRELALATLKAVLALGYRIVASEPARESRT